MVEEEGKVEAPRLRRLHLLSALLICLFLTVHIGNHIAGLAGQDVHIAYMAAARSIYRQPFIETILLVLIAWQVVSGVTMALRGWRERSGAVAWLQAGSGLYLAFFLANHVGAVVLGRSYLGLDTDFRFAAAGFHVAPFAWFFAPYYFLGVFALFAHIGCAFYWNLGADRTGRAVLASLAAVGAVLGLLFVAAMAGLIYPVDIPDAYLATYR